MISGQVLGSLRQSRDSCAPRGGWARRGVWAVLLALGLLAPGAQADGNFEWAAAMGGTDRDWGRGIAVDEAGNVYTTGSFNRTVDFNPGSGTFNLTSAGRGDIFVQKMDTNGHFLWARALGGRLSDEGLGIAVDGAGNVYTTGQFEGTADFDPGPGIFNLTSAGGFDIFVQKMDTNGDFVWARSMGGTGGQKALDIAVDGTGNVYTTGAFEGMTDFDPSADVFHLSSVGGWDIFVHKMDANGHFLWARAMGGTMEDRGFGIAVDGAGNVYTTGHFSGNAEFDPGLDTFELVSAGIADIFVQKMDTNGDFVWARRMGGMSGESSHGIAVDDAGNVYTTGVFSGTSDFDPGPDSFDITVGGGAIFVSKLDTNGHFVWAGAMSAASLGAGLSIAVDDTGDVYTTGWFFGIADFDPGPETYILESSFSWNTFVSKLDTGGNFVWARSIDSRGSNTSEGFGIAVDGLGNVYTTGYFDGSPDFDPGPGSFSLWSAGKEDIFVLKLSGPPDVTPPSVTTIAPATAGPTNAIFVDFTVTFDEAVVNFEDASDVVIEHTGTANTSASITGGPEVYTVDVDGISGDGSFTLSVNTASDVADMAGNLLASSVTSAPVVIDNTPPTITALTVSPSAIAPGDVAIIQFGVSEMLLGDPLVLVAGTTAAVAPLEAVKSMGHSYSWTAPADAPVGRITGRTLVPGVGYFNPDPWPYGPQTLEITLTDLAGNTITHTEPDSLALVSGLPVAWPWLAVLAMIFAAVFVFRTRRKIRSD